MSIAPLVVSVTTQEVHPIYVGGGIFVLLLLMLAGLVAFGAGRDHS